MPEITVSKDYDGIKIERFIKRSLPHIPLSMIFKLLRKGKVRVNKRKVVNNYRVKSGDSVILHISSDLFYEDRGNDTQPVQKYVLSKSDIILNNDIFIAINKPPHLSVHGGEGHNGFLLLDAVHCYLGYDSSSLRFAPTPVHRLDIGTSGVLIFAKTYDFLRRFNQLQKDRRVHKIYLGLVSSAPEKDRVVIELPVLRRDRPASRGIGKVGKTILRLLKGSEKDGMVFSLLQIDIETGRTHQIRSHLFQSRLFLVGDKLYGNSDINNWAQKMLGLNRQFLHASLVRFEYDGHKFELRAPLTSDLVYALDLLGIESKSVEGEL